MVSSWLSTKELFVNGNKWKLSRLNMLHYKECKRAFEESGEAYSIGNYHDIVRVTFDAK